MISINKIDLLLLCIIIYSIANLIVKFQLYADREAIVDLIHRRIDAAEHIRINIARQRARHHSVWIDAAGHRRVLRRQFLFSNIQIEQYIQTKV